MSNKATTSVSVTRPHSDGAHSTGQHSIELGSSSPMAWVEHVIDHFDEFLVDHAACERKASAVATSMICHYPDKDKLVSEMADLAVEEMIHYREVLKIIHARNIKLTSDTKDPYVNSMRKQVRHGREFYFQDRLLAAGIIEARGAERFNLIATHHPDQELRQFYERLTASEARHKDLFIDLAYHYCNADEVSSRLRELLFFEADILASLDIRAALH